MRYLKLGLKLIALTIVILWTLIPIVWFFMMSFTTYGGLPRGIALPKILTLDSYKAATTGIYSVLPGIKDSLIFSGVCILLVLLTCFTSSYACSRLRGTHSTIIHYLLVVIRGVPFVGIGIPYYIMFRNWGLMDTVWAPAFGLTTISLPMNIWILTQFINGIPREFEEAAVIDGASFFDKFFRIMLPLMLPGVFTILILTFFGAYNHYVLCLMLSRGTFSPVSVKVAGFATELTVRWPEMSAAAVIGMIPMILVFVIFGKYLLRGFSSLAVR